MTKEDVRKYVEANEDIKKMLHRFMRHNDNIITSSLDDDEEKKMHMTFMNAYKEDIKKLWDYVKDNRVAFLGYLQDEGISDFYEAKQWADENSNDIQKNPLADPSLTKAQREGLEEFHRWLNRNCEKTGFMGDSEAGGMRDFANKFMSQPASVQLKALYLLETGKRKAPDEAGFDDFHSQMNYVPSLDKIKKPLIASPLKIWKRSNGSHFYWSKLNQSLKIAEKSAVKLEEFRKDLRKDVKPAPGKDYIEEHTKLNTLNSIAKLVDPDKIVVPSVNAQTKEVTMVRDDFTASNIKFCKIRAGMINRTMDSAEEKERKAAEALNNYSDILPALKYDRESTKTVKGAWEVGTDIISLKDNYLNAERTFKATLAMLNDNHELGNPPPKGIVAYLNSDSSYLKDLPSNLFDGLNLVGEAADMVNTIVNFKKNYANTNKMQKLTGTLNFLTNASDGTFHVAQMLMSASNTKAISALEGGFDTFKAVSTSALGIEGMLIASKNIATAVKQGYNRYCATNAKMVAEGSRRLTKDQKKRINDIADFSHSKSVKAQRTAIRGIFKGAGITATSAGATAIAAVPFLGPAILAGVTGISIYEQVRGRKNRKALARMAVDKLVTGSEKIEKKTTDHSRRLQDRLDRYVPGDKTAEKIRKFSEKQNKIKDRTRNESAVKAGHTSLFTCTAGATSAVADELLKQVFLINPELGFVDGNIITNSREHASYRRERTSYHELLASMGVEVRHKSREEVRDAKKFEKRLQEKKAAQLGS